MLLIAEVKKRPNGRKIYVCKYLYSNATESRICVVFSSSRSCYFTLLELRGLRRVHCSFSVEVNLCETEAKFFSLRNDTEGYFRLVFFDEK